jgi:hypothetical protein
MNSWNICIGILSAAALLACGDDSGEATAANTTSASTAGPGSGGQGAGGTTSTGGEGGGGASLPNPAEDWTRDIVSTAIELDVGAMTGKATIVLAGSASLAASFQTGDLSILSVGDGTAELLYQQQGAQLDVGVPSTGGDATLVIDYQFAVHDNFDGWMPAQGVTFLWPEFCGNLFPC